MVNVNKLKSKFVEKGYSVAQVADGSNISLYTLYRRLKNPSEFTVGEADALAAFLGLRANEAADIFFGQFVA